MVTLGLCRLTRVSVVSLEEQPRCCQVQRTRAPVIKTKLPEDSQLPCADARSLPAAKPVEIRF